MSAREIFETIWMLLMAAGIVVLILQLARVVSALQVLSRDVRFVARFVSKLEDHPHHGPVTHHAFGIMAPSYVSWRWTSGKWELESSDISIDDAGSPPARPGLCEDEIVLQPRQ